MADPSTFSTPRQAARSTRHVHRVFWVLVAVAVLATGSLTSALAAPSGPATGLRVALSGLVAMVSTALATRVMIALERARRRASVERTLPAAGPTTLDRRG